MQKYLLIALGLIATIGLVVLFRYETNIAANGFTVRTDRLTGAIEYCPPGGSCYTPKSRDFPISDRCEQALARANVRLGDGEGDDLDLELAKLLPDCEGLGP